MKRLRIEPAFKTEAELCAAFIGWVARKATEWTCYAETGGWDILLAHGDGTQLGVQAKLILNIEVLSQAIESGWGWGSDDTGPDYRGVLVPMRANGRALCDALGLTMIEHRGKPILPHETHDFYPDLGREAWRHWHFRNPTSRHELPAYVPDVRAGVPGPSQLTKWKIAALEICAIIEVRGHVTRQDFSLAGIDHRRWVEQWLEAIPERKGAWRWKNGDPFSKQHPVVYPQVLAKIKERGIGSEPLLPL